MSGALSTHYDLAKRVGDIVVAATGLIVFSPVLLVVALLVRVQLGTPIIFSQERPGLGGKIFRLYKFRTMKNVDLASGLVTDQQRMNEFGSVLRSTSLDELPTLFNVLKGDMSIVGPRPLLVRYLPRYTSDQARRHDVRPGVTGLAQVSGRNALSWDDKFALDVLYVDTRSLLVDLNIMWRTVSAVTRRENISAPGETTMSEFQGEPHKFEQKDDRSSRN